LIEPNKIKNFSDQVKAKPPFSNGLASCKESGYIQYGNRTDRKDKRVFKVDTALRSAPFARFAVYIFHDETANAMKLIECVPNFSEGRDRSIIEAVRSAVWGPALLFLDVDPGPDPNRTVMSFAGPAEAVLEAAFRGAKVAMDRIDMNRHRGVHPRLGAMDVCPFVPLGESGMDVCVGLALELGRRIGDLGVPVYLYGEAASNPKRRSLSAIRSGGYEGLEDKLKSPDWFPDFGPSVFNSRSGAAVVGARLPLVAFNVNLDEDRRDIADRIAWSIRESGEGKEKLESVQAIGWRLASSCIAQISTNILDFRKTPLHVVYDACSRLAHEAGLRVTGSQIVGLCPLEAILEAGRESRRRKGVEETDRSKLIAEAVSALGLDDLAPFLPEQKILENRLIGSA
jgi:glutamate formiminotransferase / formiminotetrahydrofolate cyclodeaminase